MKNPNWTRNKTGRGRGAVGCEGRLQGEREGGLYVTEGGAWSLVTVP